MNYPSDDLLIPLEIRKKPFLQHQAYAQNILNYNGYCENTLRNQENLLLTQQIRPQHKIISSTIQPPWENVTFKYNPLHQDIDTIEEKTEFGESQINMNMYRTNDFENRNNNENNNIYLESVHNTESIDKVEPIPATTTITAGFELFDTAGICYGNFLKTQRLPTQTITPIQPVRKFQSPNPIVYKAKYKNLSLRNRPQTRAQTRLFQRPHTQQNFRNQYNQHPQQFHQQQNFLSNNIQYKTNRRIINQQQQFFEQQKQQQKLIRTKNMFSRNNLRAFNQKQNTNRKHNNNLNYYKKTLVRHKSKFRSVISKKLLKIKEKNNDIEYCFLNCCNFLQSKSRFKLKFLKKCPCGTSNMKPESYYDVSYAKQVDSTNDTDTNYNDKRGEVTKLQSSSSSSSTSACTTVSSKDLSKKMPSTRTHSQGDLQSKSSTNPTQKTPNQLPFQSNSAVNTDLQRLYNNWKLDPGYKQKLEESEIRHGLHNWGLWRTKMNEILIMSIMNSNSQDSTEDGYEKIRSIRFHKEQFKLDPKTARFIYYYGSNQEVKPILDPDSYMFRGIPRAHQTQLRNVINNNSTDHDLVANEKQMKETVENVEESKEKDIKLTGTETIASIRTISSKGADGKGPTQMSKNSEENDVAKKKQADKLFSGNNVREKVKAFEIVSESSGNNSKIQRHNFKDEISPKEEEIEKIKQKFENQNKSSLLFLQQPPPPPPPPPPPLPPHLPPPPLPALPGHLSIENSKKTDVDLKHDINVNSLLTDINCTVKRYEQNRSQDPKSNGKLILNNKFRKEKNGKMEILKAAEGDIIFGNGSEHQRSMPSISTRSNIDDFSEKVFDEEDKRPISTDNISGVQLGTESPLLMPDEEAKVKKGKNGKKDNLKFKLIKHDGYSYLLPFKNILKSKKRSVDINDSQNFTSATNTPIPDEITKSDEIAIKKTTKNKFLSGLQKATKMSTAAATPSKTSKTSKPMEAKQRMVTPKIGSKKIRTHRRPSAAAKPKLIKNKMNKKASQRNKNHGSVKQKATNHVNRSNNNNNLCNLPGIETESVHSKVSKFLNESNDLTNFSQIDDKDIIDLTSDTEELKTAKPNNEKPISETIDVKSNKLSDIIKLAKNLDPPKIPPPIPPPPTLPSRLRDTSTSLAVPPPPPPPPLSGIQKAKKKLADFEEKIFPRRRAPTPPSLSVESQSPEPLQIQQKKTQKQRGLSNDTLPQKPINNKAMKNSSSVDPSGRKPILINSNENPMKTVTEVNRNFLHIKSENKSKNKTVIKSGQDEIILTKNNFRKIKEPSNKKQTTVKQFEKKNFFKSVEVYRKETHTELASEESEEEDFEEERRKARLNRRKKDKIATVECAAMQDITSSVSYDCKCHSMRYDYDDGENKTSESKFAKPSKQSKKNTNNDIYNKNENFTISKTTTTKTRIVPVPQTPSFDCVTTYIESDAVEETKGSTIIKKLEKIRFEPKILLGGSNTTNGLTNTTTTTDEMIVRSNGKCNQTYIHPNQFHNDELNNSKINELLNSEHEMNTSKTKPKTSKQILAEIAMLTNGTTPRRKLLVNEIESQSTLNSNSKSAAFSN